MTPSNLLSLFTGCALLFLVSCSASQSKNQSFLSSYKGITQKSKTSNQTTFVGDLSKLQNYNSIYLEEVKVIPSDLSEDTTITSAEIASLREKFRADLEKELSASRFTLTNKKSAKTLSLRAAITELQPGNPALFGAGYIPYVGTAITASSVAAGTETGAGAATIEAEVLDSNTRERFYAIVDKQAGNKLKPGSGLTRWGEAESAFRRWATTIRVAISQ